MKTTGLVRVTIAAPQRRVDLALPEQSAVAELLPGLLGKAGEHLADDGAPAGGWVLRRTDGTLLTPGRTIAAHRIRDGEILHLVPRDTEWPELEYDDLVDAVATGSGRLGSVWGPGHTRAAGLTGGTVAVLLALVTLLRAGPPWPDPALWAVGAAVVLLAAGVVLARAVGDSGAGASVGALALPFAFTGGALMLAGDRALTELGAPHLLAGSAALLLAGLLGRLGIVAGAALFTGAVATGILGVVGGWLATTDRLDATGAAAIVCGAALAFSPSLALLAIRLSRLPMPTLPRSTADLVRDDPQPPRSQVYQAVVRADALLTGLLLGVAVACAVGQLLVLRAGTRSAWVYVVLLVIGLLLRARLYPVVRQRLLFLGAGLAGAAGLALGPLTVDPDDPLAVAGPVLLLAGGFIVVVALQYSRRAPNAYLGRYAEILEVLVILAIVPVACWVLGLYGYVRGLGG